MVYAIDDDETRKTAPPTSAGRLANSHPVNAIDSHPLGSTPANKTEPIRTRLFPISDGIENPRKPLTIKNNQRPNKAGFFDPRPLMGGPVWGQKIAFRKSSVGSPDLRDGGARNRDDRAVWLAAHPPLAVISGSGSRSLAVYPGKPVR